MKALNCYQFVQKIIGPIRPIGETNADNERLDNLRQMTELVDELLQDISAVSMDRNRVEYSIKTAGQYAYKFLQQIKQNEFE